MLAISVTLGVIIMGHTFWAIIYGLNSISQCVEIGFSLDGVRFADTLPILQGPLRSGLFNIL